MAVELPLPVTALPLFASVPDAEAWKGSVPGEPPFSLYPNVTVALAPGSRSAGSGRLVGDAAAPPVASVWRVTCTPRAVVPPVLVTSVETVKSCPRSIALGRVTETDRIAGSWTEAAAGGE